MLAVGWLFGVESKVRLALELVVLANVVFTSSHSCVHVRLDLEQ
jgi:hypothetical protein